MQVDVAQAVPEDAAHSGALHHPAATFWSSRLQGRAHSPPRLFPPLRTVHGLPPPGQDPGPLYVFSVMYWTRGTNMGCCTALPDPILVLQPSSVGAARFMARTLFPSVALRGCPVPFHTAMVLVAIPKKVFAPGAFGGIPISNVKLFDTSFLLSIRIIVWSVPCQVSRHGFHVIFMLR